MAKNKNIANRTNKNGKGKKYKKTVKTFFKPINFSFNVLNNKKRLDSLDKTVSNEEEEKDTENFENFFNNQSNSVFGLRIGSNAKNENTGKTLEEDLKNVPKETAQTNQEKNQDNSPYNIVRTRDYNPAVNIINPQRTYEPIQRNIAGDFAVGNLRVWDNDRGIGRNRIIRNPGQTNIQRNTRLVNPEMQSWMENQQINPQLNDYTSQIINPEVYTHPTQTEERREIRRKR